MPYRNALAPTPVNQLAEMAQQNLTMPEALLYRLYRSNPVLNSTPITFRGQGVPDNAGLESFPAGESGSSKYPRPSNLPIDRGGIELSENKKPVSPRDVVADWAGHIGNDPNDPSYNIKLADIYSRFAQSLDPKLLQKRYEYDVANQGEKRPFDIWARLSGIPAMFRGYTFNQWPDEFNNKVFTPEQKRIMDEARSHLGMR